MTKFEYIPPRPIYWFQVINGDIEANEKMLAELRRLTPWADGEECWIGDTDDDPLSDPNQIIYNHRGIIANENKYGYFGQIITMIGTEIQIKD